jgi:hypothetical protein
VAGSGITSFGYRGKLVARGEATRGGRAYQPQQRESAETAVSDGIETASIHLAIAIVRLKQAQCSELWRV